MKAKAAIRKTGFGVTGNDRSKGIFTVDAKLESIRPLFSRMIKLFGQKLDIVP